LRSDVGEATIRVRMSTTGLIVDDQAGRWPY